MRVDVLYGVRALCACAHACVRACWCDARRACLHKQHTLRRPTNANSVRWSPTEIPTGMQTTCLCMLSGCCSFLRTQILLRYQGCNSPYYTESHHKWRAHVREFVEKHMIPYVHKWEQQNTTLPNDLFLAAGQAGASPPDTLSLTSRFPSLFRFSCTLSLNLSLRYLSTVVTIVSIMEKFVDNTI